MGKKEKKDRDAAPDPGVEMRLRIAGRVTYLRELNETMKRTIAARNAGLMTEAAAKKVLDATTAEIMDTQSKIGRAVALEDL